MTFAEAELISTKKTKYPFKGNGIKGTRNVFIWAISKDKIYIGNDERGYEICMYDLDGNLKRKIKKEYVPVKVPEEAKKRFLKQYEKPEYEVYRKKVYFPKYMPPFQYFFTDDEGRLFVMTYEKSKTSNEYMYDIFNANGVFIGRTSLANFYIDDFGEATLDAKAISDRLYCLREKESGYKELAVYMIRWE